MTRTHLLIFSTAMVTLTALGCADTLDRARNDVEQENNWCINCEMQTDREPVTTPPKKEEPKKEEPKKEEPKTPVVNPTPEVNWQYSRLPKIKIYRARDYYCTISAFNTAECWGPAFERLQNVPQTYRDVEQMALGDDGLCILNTNGKVQCHGYPLQPRFNLRFTMRHITMSENGLLCAIGGYTQDQSSLSCEALVADRLLMSRASTFPADDIQYSNLTVSMVTQGNEDTPMACGVLAESEHAMCQTHVRSRSIFEGPFKKFYHMDPLYSCGLTTDNALRCINTIGGEAGIDQPLQDLYSAYCGQTEQGNVVCWTPNPRLHSLRATELITETITKQKVRDFSMVRRRNITDPIEWCAVNEHGAIACSDFIEQ